MRKFKYCVILVMVAVMVASSLLPALHLQVSAEDVITATPVIEPEISETPLPSATMEATAPETPPTITTSSVVTDETTEPVAEISDSTPEPDMGILATSVSVIPASGNLGGWMEILGTGFTPYTSVVANIDWYGTGNPELYTGRADAAGKVTLGSTIPMNAVVGPVNIEFNTADGNHPQTLTFTVTCCAPPQLSLWPNYGIEGERLTLVGSGFRPNDTIEIRHNAEDGTLLTTVASSEDGGLFTEVGIPIGTPVGANTFWLVSDEITGSVAFTVSDPINPNLYLTPDTGHPNSVIDFSGNNFDPGEQVSIHQGSGSGPILLEVVASPTGEISGRFSLHEPDPDTPYTIVAVGSLGQATATFTTDNNPTLLATASSSWVTPGETITIGGSGYPASQPVNIFLDHIGWMPDYTTDADSNSEFSIDIQIPEDTISPEITVFVADYRGFYTNITLEVGRPPAKLSVVPDVLRPNTVMTYRGANFDPDEEVEISLGGQLIATVFADTNGEIESSVVIPGNTAIGTVTLSATGRSGQTASIDLYIRDAIVVTTSPTAAPAYTSMTITAANFDPNEVVTFRIAGYTGNPLGKVTANGSGVASITVTVPAYTPKSYWISAEGTSGSRNAILFEITATTVITSPESSLAGTTVTVTATGFLPGESVTFRLAGYTGRFLGTANANGNGVAEIQAFIPVDFPIGKFWMTARGTSGARAQSYFTVSGPPAIKITTSPTSGLAGSTITATATGFQPNEFVTFRYAGYTGTYLGQARAASNGTVSRQVVIPVTAKTQSYWISAEGTSGKRDAVLFAVTGPPVIEITTSPTSGLAGSSLTATAIGFQPNELVTFRYAGYNGTYLGQARATSSGTVSLQVTIPVTAKTQNYWISAEGTSGKRDAVLFAVTGPPVVKITTSPTSGVTGSSVSITATGFQPNELVTFRLAGFSGRYLGQARADGNGVVVAKVTIPTNFPTGSFWMTAEGTSGKRDATLFTVKG